MTRPTSPRRRRTFRDVLVIAAMGAGIVAAGLTPALTASAGSTTAITGTVHAEGAAVVGITVGFWNPSAGVVAATRSTAEGAFQLALPSATDGFLFAGTAPDSTTALTRLAGEDYVRGLIGAATTTPYSAPIYQGALAATPSHLGGGQPLDLRLQRAGRVSAQPPAGFGAGARVELRRLDGSIVQRLRADASGRFGSDDLVPGHYEVVLVPPAPEVPVHLPVVIRSAAVAVIRLPAPATGARLSGQVTTGGLPISDPVPVLLVQNGALVQRTTSDASGRYTITGIDAGTFQVDFGTYAVPGPLTVAIGGASSVPSPTPTGTPTPTGSASASAATPAVTVPGQVPTDATQTVDGFVPASSTVTVDAARDDVTLDQDLAPAATLTGSVPIAEGATTVIAEDAVTHALLRVGASSGSTGRFVLGGLPTDGRQLQVYAVDSPADLATARYGVVTVVAGDGADVGTIDLTSPALSLTGEVGDTTAGTVASGPLGSPGVRTAAIASSGTYALQGLVPGSYGLVVADGDHLPATPVAVDLLQSGTRNLSHGSRPAAFKAWFISGGAGLGAVGGRAVSAAGDVMVVGPRTHSGHVTVDGLAPGIYTFDQSSFAGSVPTDDGPWWYGGPAGSFTVRAGAVTDVGPLELHAHQTRANVYILRKLPTVRARP